MSGQILSLRPSTPRFRFAGRWPRLPWTKAAAPSARYRSSKRRTCQIDRDRSRPRAVAPRPRTGSAGWRTWPSVGSSRHVGQRGRPRANLRGPPIGARDYSRNSAACTQREGADVQERRIRVWGPPVGPSCVHEARSVGRVPRSAQHAGVGGVERRATIDERPDVVERQVTRWMRRMLGTIARAHVAVLADVARDHPLG